ncbi:MAG: YegS/Rv2252/BmrU family lipid kinase [Firmicutes bacterium]|nr:YegS/Rv2252/BmrU family lipid kinase [Bacillota bacterium]
MKKFKLIYNPYSGGGIFKDKLDDFIYSMQKNGYEVSVFRSCDIGDIDRHIGQMDHGWDAIGAAGGDGTINLVINAMMRHGLADIPLALIPTGTANDFCTFLGIPQDIEQCCDVIGEGRTEYTDLGLINDSRYFINVCAGGLFSNVSLEIDKTFKDLFGKVAYYVKGMEQLSTFKPIPMRIISSRNGVYENNINLFLVLNSSGTGGIEGISPHASINDGMLDFVAFANIPWPDLTKLVFDFLKGEHLSSDGIIFFKDSKIKIENLSPDRRFITTDIDGERGPDMPVEIKTVPKAIKIFAK